MTNEFVASLLQAVQKRMSTALGTTPRQLHRGRPDAKTYGGGACRFAGTWTNPATQRPAAISHEKLEELRQAYLPVSLDGDAVLFQCNRTDTGWVIELVNNEGVVKYPAKPAVIDKNSIAMVKLTPRVPCRQWIDWRTGDNLEAVDGKVCIQIEPGSTRFVEMRREKCICVKSDIARDNFLGLFSSAPRIGVVPSKTNNLGGTAVRLRMQ